MPISWGSRWISSSRRRLADFRLSRGERRSMHALFLIQFAFMVALQAQGRPWHLPDP
jgi:hypothetical protein